MTTLEKSGPKQFSQPLRSFATFGIVFFLITTVLAALVIIPATSKILESQHSRNIRDDFTLETELFKNYVDSHVYRLQDLAQLPSLIDATVLSDASNPQLTELLDNINIGGDSAHLVVQDITGTVLIQTNHSFQSSYIEGIDWVHQIADGTIAHYFKLLSQKGDHFSFQIAVPIISNGSIKGVLNAEVTVLLSDVFVAQAIDRVAFKLVQGPTTVHTERSHIGNSREDSIQLENLNLMFTYITDDAIILEKERSLRNSILIVMFTGFGISFVLFVFIEYRRLASRDASGNPKLQFSRAYTIPVAIAIIGIATSIIAFLIILNTQQSAIDSNLLNKSKAHIETIRQRINDNLDVLDSIRLIFDTSGYVERHEFATFVTHTKENNPNFNSIHWIPNVPLMVREEFERKAQMSGQPDYSIRELTPEGEMINAGIRENYFPVYYAEPPESRGITIGFDLATNSKLLSALTKAGTSGNMVAMTPSVLIKENSQQALLVFNPVYHENVYHNLQATNGFDNIKGFALLTLNADDVIGDTLLNDPHIQSIHIQDISDPDNPKEILGETIATPKYSFTESINIAGKTWRVNIDMDATEVTMRWVSWLVLFAGTLFTLLITAGLVHLIRRREIVEALVKTRTSEIRTLSSIVAKSNDAFIITAKEGSDPDNDLRNIVYINEAFTNLSGYSQNEAIGKTPGTLLHGEKTDQKQLEELYNSVKQGNSFRGDFMHYTKSNEAYWVNINVSPLKDDDGKITQFACVMRDISDRKRAENERERLIGKLTDSNEELERFAFVCSHDLQEPLRMIRSFSEKLQAHLAADLVNDEKGVKYLGFITDGAQRAQHLISDILNYSSLSKDPKKLERVNSENLVVSIKLMMRAALDENGGKIIHDDLPEVQGHKTQLYQLFQNLINNAIKYQTPGTTPLVKLHAIDAGKFWQFSIKDNGIGMEARHLPKIFDVFQRLHRRDQYSGTGVGLSICKKVIERHGGTIWVDSEAGVGTTFHFTLLKPILTEVKDERRKAG